MMNIFSFTGVLHKDTRRLQGPGVQTTPTKRTALPSEPHLCDSKNTLSENISFQHYLRGWCINGLFSWTSCQISTFCHVPCRHTRYPLASGKDAHVLIKPCAHGFNVPVTQSCSCQYRTARADDVVRHTILSKATNSQKGWRVEVEWRVTQTHKQLSPWRAEFTSHFSPSISHQFLSLTTWNSQNLCV